MNVSKDLHWKSISKKQIKTDNLQKNNIFSQKTLKMKNAMRNFLDRITGKEKQKFIEKIDQIKTKLITTQDKMLEDEENIKKLNLNLHEEKHKTKVLQINIKHKDKEIETLKLQLEQYKLELQEKNILLESMQIEKSLEDAQEKKKEIISEPDNSESKIISIKNNLTNTQNELEKAKKKWKIKEEETREYKKKLQEIIQMMANISKEEVHNGVISIQQNTLNEQGEKIVRKFFKYNDTIIEYNEKAISNLENEEIIEDSKIQTKIIPFYTYNQNVEQEQDFLELAE